MNKFRRKCGGQVTVELIMVLPVFMIMMFFVLEYGNIAYHTIIANHASYEFARIGSLVGSKKPSGSAERAVMQQKINAAKRKVFGADSERIQVALKLETTGVDPMYQKHRHEDVIVTVTYPVRLIFPGTSYILASEPKRLGIKKIQAVTRMPVEKSYLSSDTR